MSVRDEVKARIMEVMDEARQLGFDDISYAKAKFPGTPENVLWECWCRLEDEDTENWWRNVEKTIEGEIVERALTKK